MTPSQTKLMDQCRAEAEAKYPEKYNHFEYRQAYAQALYSERSKWLAPELPPRPPQGIGEQLPRYGLKWNGPNQPLSVPMDDGYWTPFHIADASIKELVQRVHDERSKAPTVEQVMQCLRDHVWAEGEEMNEPNQWRFRSRLTKLFNGG